MTRRSPPRPALPQYRPHALDKFALHSDIAANLKKLVSVASVHVLVSTKHVPSDSPCSPWPACGLIGRGVHLEWNAVLQVASGDFPHCLFYGPPGAGKKTLIMAVLREVYGPGAEKVRWEHASTHAARLMLDHATSPAAAERFGPTSCIYQAPHVSTCPTS